MANSSSLCLLRASLVKLRRSASEDEKPSNSIPNFLLLHQAEFRKPLSIRSNTEYLRHHVTCKLSESDHGIASFAIAVTTMAGITIICLEDPASAVASDHKDLQNVMVSYTSSNSSLDLRTDPTFSMAIPIPDEQIWVYAQNGFIAPMPRHAPGDGLITPSPVPRGRQPLHSHSQQAVQCPQWTPSELEMVLPDFHGRPKPFPRQGPHWPAAAPPMERGLAGEAAVLAQASILQEGVGLLELAPYEEEMNAEESSEKEREDQVSLPKELGRIVTGSKFMCFNM